MKKKITSNKHEVSATKCQVCGNNRLETILSLGHQPIVQEYLTSKTLGCAETTYPLNLCMCQRCGLVQIDYVADPKVVFPERYPYRTGLTNMLVRNFQNLAEELEGRDLLGAGKLIVDIGSNDGTLLKVFKDKGMRVVGVEPTDAAKVANRIGIPTIQAFFDDRSVSQIIKKYGKADLITATNVFAHIPNPKKLAKNMGKLLNDGGVFVSESQYLADIVEKLEFDTIYHEHLRFYALGSLKKLFNISGLSIVDAERIKAAGGSIRVYAMKGKRKISERGLGILEAEKKAGLHTADRLKDFAKRAIEAKVGLISMVSGLKANGARIAGLSSAARSNTLLGFSHIDFNLVSYLGEKRGSPKIGMYTPGTHIPIVDESYILEDQPDYLLVLSWHIGDELMKKMRDLGYRGKFIVPLPVPKIV